MLNLDKDALKKELAKSEEYQSSITRYSIAGIQPTIMSE